MTVVSASSVYRILSKYMLSELNCGALDKLLLINKQRCIENVRTARAKFKFLDNGRPY